MENVVEWPYNKVLELIALFHQRPILWDTECNEYRDRQKRHEATIELAMQFNVEKDEIERKLKNLQSHFYREIKKEKVSRLSATDGIYKSKWFAYQAMKFLADRNKPRRKRRTGGKSTTEWWQKRMVDLRVSRTKHNDKSRRCGLFGTRLKKSGYKKRCSSSRDSPGETIKKEIIAPDSDGTSTNFLYLDMNQQSDPNDSQMDFWDEKPVSVNGQDSMEFVAQANVIEAQQSRSIANYEDIQSNKTVGSAFSKTCSSKPNLKVISNDVITSAIEFLLAEAKAHDANDPELNFYRSLIPDIMKLSNKRRRQYKEVILCTLNKFLDEDDIDRQANV